MTPAVDGIRFLRRTRALRVMDGKFEIKTNFVTPVLFDRTVRVCHEAQRKRRRIELPPDLDAALP